MLFMLAAVYAEKYSTDKFQGKEGYKDSECCSAEQKLGFSKMSGDLLHKPLSPAASILNSNTSVVQPHCCIFHPVPVSV
jgi:hypothetical protein